jgi:hypothetical protein
MTSMLIARLRLQTPNGSKFRLRTRTGSFTCTLLAAVTSLPHALATA